MYALNTFYVRNEADTTMPCLNCGKPVTAQRSCRHVRVFCKHCNAEFEVGEYLDRMDDALEEFMASVYCDRV